MHVEGVGGDQPDPRTKGELRRKNEIQGFIDFFRFNFQWHSLSREEQSKYYEKARMERQLHMELYPGWSARDNYGYGSKKKKRKKDRGSPSDISSGEWRRNKRTFLVVGG